MFFNIPFQLKYDFVTLCMKCIIYIYVYSYILIILKEFHKQTKDNMRFNLM